MTNKIEKLNVTRKKYKHFDGFYIKGCPALDGMLFLKDICDKIDEIIDYINPESEINSSEDKK
jgi:hypothetical protein